MSDQTDYSEGDRALFDLLRKLEPIDYDRQVPQTALFAGIEAATSAVPSVAEPSIPAVAAAAPQSRSPRWATRITVAAAIVAVAAGLALPMMRSDRENPASIIAQATLSSEGLVGAPAGLEGSAEVVRQGNERLLRVDIGNAGPASGQFLELWLIRGDISGMVSLGTVRADGEYQLPAGLQVDEYPIVDVSTEPYDGDPAHSGDSLLRGQLGT